MRFRPVDVLLVCVTVATAWLVAVRPFTVVEFPPITDLPFHASAISIFRHYFDPSFHFREQFEIHLLESPYWTFYALGAFFALFMPVVTATKTATVILLLTLPAGLAFMFHSMKKSPALGLLGFAFIWNKLTHWGFINFEAAIGLFAIVIGLTLQTLDAPTPRRQWALGAVLLLLFVTHVFRYPFAVAGIIGTTLVMFPATRRWKPVVVPVLPSLLLFTLWFTTRKVAFAEGQAEPLRMHFERFDEIPALLFGSFVGSEERTLADTTYRTIAAFAIVLVAFVLIERRWRDWSKRERLWGAGVTLVAIGMSLGCLVMFLTLPMEMGAGWWYIYPREIIPTLFMALGALPTFPRREWVKLPLLAIVLWATVAQASLVTENYALFEEATRDFQTILSDIPEAPKLGYMVFYHGGSTRSDTPFIHLPAWVQAEKGGWLSWHFVSFNVLPVSYRKGSPAVPPPTPVRFEWQPGLFDVSTHGRFFDWFLVRNPTSPERLFNVDPTIRLFRHQGTWWLFHRETSASVSAMAPGIN